MSNGIDRLSRRAILRRACPFCGAGLLVGFVPGLKHDREWGSLGVTCREFPKCDYSLRLDGLQTRPSFLTGRNPLPPEFVTDAKGHFEEMTPAKKKEFCEQARARYALPRERDA